MALSNCSKISPGSSFWPETFTANVLQLKQAKTNLVDLIMFFKATFKSKQDA